jgi:hypothetical protein
VLVSAPGACQHAVCLRRMLDVAHRVREVPNCNDR